MEQHPINGQLPSREEPIILEESFGGRRRTLAVFIICCGLLLAAFSVSAMWMQKGDGAWDEGLGSFWKPDGQPPADDAEESADMDGNTDGESESDPVPDPIPALPAGATPVVTMDLSAPTLGRDYIHNETVYAPKVSVLLERSLDFSDSTEKPRVLILHTHTSESYLPAGTSYIEGAVGDVTYSRNEKQNVLSVGKVLADTLNQKGITAIHCTVMHDDPTLSGSYARMSETVKRYLASYPSIELVIDLHRDAVMSVDGEVVRAVTEHEGEAVAQVMAVVGSDGNGTEHPRWEENLALALQLRERLNEKADALCRPASLRNSSYHQELANYALLLEIGTSANATEEAERAAVLVGEILSEMLQAR